MKKTIIYALLASLLIIQFIRPEKNESKGPFPNDIQTKFPMGSTVKATIERSCYDCHSNNTRYPWYYHIQPITWWLQHHVDEGKSELNFNEFASYESNKMDHKLEEMAEAVGDGWMPLKSYQLIHKNVQLSEAEKKAIIEWVNQSRSALNATSVHTETYETKQNEVD